MRILLFIGSLRTGGAERQFVMLSNGLAARGHDVLPVVLHPGGQNWDELRAAENIRPVSLFRRRPSRFGLVFNLLFAPLRLRVLCRGSDVVYSVLLLTNIIAWFATRGSMKTRLVWGFRASSYGDSWKARWPFRICRALSSSVRLIIVNSGPGLELLKLSGFNSVESLIIPNGINVHQYRFSGKARRRLRSALGMPPGAKVVGHIARFHPMKDHRSFIRAAITVANRHPDVYFILAGKGVRADNRSLIDLIPNSLISRFCFLDDRDDIPDLMSVMDVFCLCSAWGEGFPNVLGEAMAVGLPCVATDIGDASLLLNDAGILVEAGNDCEIAAAVSKLLTVDSRTGAEERRRLVSERFSVDRMVDEFGASFSRIAAKPDETI